MSMSELATQNELQQDRYINLDIATDYFKGIGQPKYAKCAVMAENILNLFLSTENSGDDSPYTICLSLQPKVNAPSEKNSRETQAACDGFRIYYESELPQHTKDLMMLTEGL